jgi:repressor LexA
MNQLTGKQRAVLHFVETYQENEGTPPTVREIANHFGFRSPKAVTDHLAALEKKGWITRRSGSARGLRVLADRKTSEVTSGIPIVGDVAAGLPILAVENVLGTLSMDSAFGRGELFAVRVRGDSMMDAGILDGDHVVVRRSPVVENLAIAVVYLEGEATVKKLRKTATGYELIAGNSRYPPVAITHEAQGFSIAGPVVGVVRKM